MKLGFFSVLGLIFITLKLMGYIDWSWWLVLLPLYGGIIVAVLIAFVVAAYKTWRKYQAVKKMEKF